MAIGIGTQIEGAVKPDSLTVDAYEPLLSAHRLTTIETNQQGMWDYSGGTSVVYAGYAPRGLATSSTGWLLQFFQYDGNGNVTSRTISYDSWDNRTGASYS